MDNTVNFDLASHMVNTYSDTVMKIAYQHTGNIHDAQDVTQDVFLSLIQRNLSSLSESELKAYIIRTAVNKCHDFHRRIKRHNIAYLEDIEPIFSEEEQSILDEVMSLPPKYRDVIYLHYYEGYQVNEIAEMLHSKPATISSQLSRAREKLKLLLGG